MPRRQSKPPRSRRQPVATYTYCDAAGRPVYRLARYQPKGFRFLKLDGSPWKASKRRSLLYRLPELLAADPTEPVFIVEGEKDVDRLLSAGLVATCNDNGGGKDKWRRPHSLPLRDRDVIILPDNDKTGRAHAEEVALRLKDIAASIRIVQLPDLPPKGDVSDWLDSQGSAADLLQLCEAAPLWLQRVARPELLHDDHHLIGNAYAREQVYISPLLAQEKLLLIMLLDFAPHTPPQRELAGYLGVTDRRVRQMLAKLKVQGLIAEQVTGRRRSYEVHTSRLLPSK